MLRKKLHYMILIVLIPIIGIGALLWNKSFSASTCDKMGNPSDKDRCHEKVAIINRESVLCRKISNQTTRDECYYILERIDRLPCKMINPCSRLFGVK